MDALGKPLDHLWLTVAVFLPMAAALLFLARNALRRRASDRRLRAMVENALVGVAQLAPDRRWTEVNPALCRTLEREPGKLLGQPLDDICHADDRDTCLGIFGAIARGDSEAETLEMRFTLPDGSAAHCHVTIQCIRKPDGSIDAYWLSARDISQRVETQRQLAIQMARSAVLLELPQRAETMDEREFMQYALDRAEALTASRIGFMHLVNEDEETIELVAWSHNTLEKYCTAAFSSHYPISQAGVWADAARRRAPAVINDYASAPDKRGLPEGHSTLVRLLSVPVVDHGAVRMMTGVGNRDDDYSETDIETLQLIGNETWRIVHRRRAEKALQLAMQVVNASPVICLRRSAAPGWPVLFVSDNVRQWGYRREELETGAPPYADLIHPDDLTRVGEAIEAHHAGGSGPCELEYRVITRDNEVIWVVDRSTPLRDADGRVGCFDGVITEITERKLQQLLLAENLARQQKLNKRLEEANNQLLQSEKMASIGQLAAGVAHELNNPIGFVHSNLGTLDGYLRDLMAIIDSYEATPCGLDLACAPRQAAGKLKSELDFDFLKDDIFSLVAESKDGLARVKKIVQDLKSFSRVGEQDWQEADLHQGLDSTLNIVWNELKYKCEVIKDYGDIPPVYCLISQLNQVFMNLLVNAGHAIEKQGRITIRSRRDGEDGVCIEVSDTGSGIAPDHLKRIFEPFFTTKPVGKGTGLGLSLSYGIVQRHHGRIEVESAVGQGTTFRLRLPIRPPVGADRPEAPAA